MTGALPWRSVEAAFTGLCGDALDGIVEPCREHRPSFVLRVARHRPKPPASWWRRGPPRTHARCRRRRLNQGRGYNALLREAPAGDGRTRRARPAGQVGAVGVHVASEARPRGVPAGRPRGGVNGRRRTPPGRPWGRGRRRGNVRAAEGGAALEARTGRATTLVALPWPSGIPKTPAGPGEHRSRRCRAQRRRTP